MQRDAGASMWQTDTTFMNAPRCRTLKLNAFVRKASMFSKKKVYIIFITEAAGRSCCPIKQFKIHKKKKVHIFILKVMQRELPGINSYFLMLHFKKCVYIDNNTQLLAVNANQKKRLFLWLVGWFLFKKNINQQNSTQTANRIKR